MENDMRFEGQVAIVTGAGRGIGRAIALQFAKEGARVACVSRTEQNAKKVADEINAMRADAAKAYAVDVADHAAVQKIGGKILEDFGRADIPVNNPGVRRDALVIPMPVEESDAVTGTNLRRAFRSAQAIVRPMPKQRSGRAIHMGPVLCVDGGIAM